MLHYLLWLVAPWINLLFQPQSFPGPSSAVMGLTLFEPQNTLHGLEGHWKDLRGVGHKCVTEHIMILGRDKQMTDPFRSIADQWNQAKTAAPLQPHGQCSGPIRVPHSNHYVSTWIVDCLFFKAVDIFLLQNIYCADSGRMRGQRPGASSSCEKWLDWAPRLRKFNKLLPAVTQVVLLTSIP